MKFQKYIFIVLVFIIALSSCKKEHNNINFKSKNGFNTSESVASLQNLDISTGELNVIVLPSSVDKGIRDVFKWYTMILAPNGKPIHILGQDQWTIEKMAYVRSVMEHYLYSDYSLTYGNKIEVSNAIANNNGAMTMYNTSASEAPVTGQDLQANETVMVGSPEYIDGSIRNAAFEEILHFVHDHGLAVTFPEFQKQLEDQTIIAIDNQKWSAWPFLPVADYDNEYLASVNDAYWGLTEFNSNNMPYVFLSREASIAGDAAGASLINSFQTNYFASQVYVSSSFTGDFIMNRIASLNYTSQSQYYKNVQLLGTNNSSIVGNELENYLTANSGNNKLTGGLANDTLDGLEGSDFAIYSGIYSDYNISTLGNITTITDSKPNRDGTDVLINIEQLRFADGDVGI